VSRSLRQRIACKGGIHETHAGRPGPFFGDCGECEKERAWKARRGTAPSAAAPHLVPDPEPEYDPLAFWLFPDWKDGADHPRSAGFEPFWMREPKEPTRQVVHRDGRYGHAVAVTTQPAKAPLGIGHHCWVCKRTYQRGEVDPDRWPVAAWTPMPVGGMRERIVCRGCIDTRRPRHSCRELTGKELRALLGEEAEQPEPQCTFCRTGTISHRDGRCWVCRRAGPKPKSKKERWEDAIARRVDQLRRDPYGNSGGAHAVEPPRRRLNRPTDPYGNPLRHDGVGWTYDEVMFGKARR
jgi:hypothetical protein